MEMRGKGVVFHASWRSGAGWLTLMCAVLLAVLLYFGIVRGVRALPLWGGVAGLALVLVPAVRRFAAKVPVLSLGPGGLRSVSMPGCTVAWDEIEEIETSAVRTTGAVVLRLRPDADALRTTRSWRQRGNQRVVSLGLLSGKELQLAADATIAAFQQYGPRDAVQALQQRAQAMADLQERLQARVPVVWALYLVVALNVGVWLAGVASGVDALAPASDVLYAWGANSAWAVQQGGQWWRLLTATVLHGGVLHLALNMLALWGAGTLLCRWYGNGRFLLLYLGAALLGSALSLHFSARTNVSVGASGAVFGVLGGMLVAVWRQRGVLPEGFARKQMGTDGVWIAVMLAQGFARPGIDNAAHVGGFVAGIAVAFLLPMLERGPQATPVPGAARQWAAVALVAAGVAVLALWPVTGSMDHARHFREQPVLQQAARQLQDAVGAFEADTRALQKAGSDAAAERRFVELVRTRHMPAFAQIGKRLSDPALDPPSEMLADLRRLVALYTQMMAIVLEPQQSPDARQRLARLKDEMQALANRMASRTQATPRKP